MVVLAFHITGNGKCAYVHLLNEYEFLIITFNLYFDLEICYLIYQVINPILERIGVMESKILNCPDFFLQK